MTRKNNLTDCKKLSTQKYIKEMENYAERVSLENMETMLQEIGLKLDLNPNNYALYYFNDMNDTHYYEMTTQPLDSKKISAYNVMSEFYQKHLRGDVKLHSEIGSRLSTLRRDYFTTIMKNKIEYIVSF